MDGTPTPNPDLPMGYAPPAITPAPIGTGLIGFLRAMISNPVSAIPAAAYEDDVVILSLAGKPLPFVCDPAVLEAILIKRPQDFPKSIVDDRLFKPAFGKSLIVTHGEDWRWKRRLAAPYFAPSALARMVPDMVAPFEALVLEWRAHGPGAIVDVSQSMTHATAEVISSALFTNQKEMSIEALSEAIDRYLQRISWTVGFATLNVPAWVPHPGMQQMKRARRDMRKLLGDLIAGRRVTKNSYSDICSDMMGATDPETGRLLSDDDLVDMLLTLVSAGHETSANALTWALLCAAEQPKLQSALRSEIVSVASDRTIAADDIPKLVLVEAFIKETMRLLPPAPLMARRTTRHETISGRSLPIGTTVFIPIYALHRHRALWETPDRFDPGRFLGERGKSIQRTAYIPFGSGPRVCIGATFAMMEMVAAAATLLRDLHFAPGGEARCEPVHRITLRPNGGLRLAVSAA